MLKQDPTKNVGSLLRLFKSGFFDTWLCITYLYKYSSHQGVVDYLCNELYRLSSESPEDIDFYVTQLCILLINQTPLSPQQTSLERFVLDQCSKTIRFAIKACWIFQGLVQDRLGGDPNHPQLLTAVRLREFCEIACVNCKRPSFPTRRAALRDDEEDKPHINTHDNTNDNTNDNSNDNTNNINDNNTNTNTNTTNEDYDGEFWQFELTKKDRCDYFNSILAFVDKLGAISQRLKNFPIDQRQDKLIEEIRLLNNDLPAGLYMPLWRDNNNFNYHCIVRIPPEDARVLNSRERVPFMLSLEILQTNEDVSSKNIHKIAMSYFSLLQSGREKEKGDGANRNSLEIDKNIITGPSQPPSVAPSSKGPFGMRWEDRMLRVKKSSIFGQQPNWSMSSVIIKYGDDLRQEQLATQLLTQFKRIWSGLPLWLRPYEILVTSSVSGIIETIPNTTSLHNLKKNTPNFTTLLDFFVDTFGEVPSDTFKTAQRNFVESMAAYSIVCYLLQIKDRHNGNILLDTEGHVIHIDFGFMLSNSPGNMYFESAPFKLTQEFVDVMGGIDNRPFQYFKALCIRGFLEARKHMEKIVTLVEMMINLGPPLPSFIMGPSAIADLRTRFSFTLTEPECVSFVESIIDESLDHFKTRAYDKYQAYVNGIIP